MSQYHKTNGFTPAEEKELQSLLKVIEAIKAREPKKAKDQCTEDEYNAILNYALNGRKGQKPPKANLFEPLKVETITPVNFETLEPRGIVEYRLCDPTWETWHNELIEAQQGYSGLIFGLASQVKNAIDGEPDRNAAEIISDTLSEVATRSSKTFTDILQGTATNALSKVKPTVNKNTILDERTGTATMREGGLSLIINKFDDLNGLKTSTCKLLDALTVAFTESDKTSPQVKISLDEYMKVCQLSDKKTARKQVIADLNTLFNISLSYEEKDINNEQGNFLKARICDMQCYDRGVIYFSFSSPYYRYLKEYAKIMPFPKALWKLNARKYPNSYALGRKIAELKNANTINGNPCDIISVKTLLKNAPFIPTGEAVKESDRQFSRRIIEPFERDMDALTADNINICQWEYCKKHGKQLTEAELQNLDYNTFITLNVRITWSEYPDQTKAIEARKQKIEAAKASRKGKPKSGNKSRTTRKK